MAHVLKRVYENVGEARSLSSPTTLTRVALVEKKLTTEYLQIESSYTLHRKHKVYGNHYRKIKAFSPLYSKSTYFESRRDSKTLKKTVQVYITCNQCF